MIIYRRHIRTIAALIVLLLLPGQGSLTATAQQFKVSGFRPLPNDVSAFITPVRDLNDEACALVKVTASEDFAFSSPLGIVKRKDDVGEIWLYLPKGSKQITIKHPQWGVLRDYKFAKPLESHLTYELTIIPPPTATTLKHDTIILTKTVTDTVTVKRRKRRPRLQPAYHIIPTISLHENGPSWGVMIAMMRRHGLFAHAATDFRGTGNTAQTCDKEGFIGSNGIMPYYTGDTRHSNYTVTAGAIHRICRTVNLFEGIGYGRKATAWQLADSEGGGYALNDGLTESGIAAEVGVMVNIGKLCVSASALTIRGRQWQACVGIGIKISKQ